ncbi:hypothetical protein GCM10029992_50550 [Glycomyces albus]
MTIDRRQLLRLAGAAGLGAGTLAGCTASEEGAAIASGPVELELWTHDPGYATYFTGAPDDPALVGGSAWTYSVHVTSIAPADIVSRLVNQAVAERPLPNLAGLVIDQFPRVMRAGIAQNLFVDLTSLTDPLGDRLLKTQPYTVDGSVYAIESDNSVSVMYYRADEFERLGIPEDVATWEELLEIGAEVAAETGQAIGMVSNGDNGAIVNGFAQMLLQRGGNLYDADGETTVLSEESIEVLQLMAEGVRTGALLSIADPYGGAAAAAIKDGNLIATVMPNWYRLYGLEANAPDQAGLWRARTIPAFAAGGHIASTLGGTAFAVLADQAETDATVEFLERTYLTPRDSSAATTRGLPADPRRPLRHPRVPGHHRPLPGRPADLRGVRRRRERHAPLLPIRRLLGPARQPRRPLLRAIQGARPRRGPHRGPARLRKAGTGLSTATAAQRPRSGHARWAPYAFISPFFLLFALFMVVPIGAGVYLSLTDWAGLGTPAYIGTANYTRLFQDPSFGAALGNTAFYTVFALAVVLPVSLLIAQALNTRGLKLRDFFRLTYFMPVVLSPIIIALIFGLVFEGEYGLFNTVLEALFGFGGISWLTDPWWARIVVVILVLWRWTGFMTIFFLAGLQAIPRELHEAAEVDGAGPVRRFFSVTLPQLKPVTAFIAVIMLVNTAQIFEEPFLLTQGAPAIRRCRCRCSYSGPPSSGRSSATPPPREWSCSS